MVECSPVPSVTDLHRREVDCVEIHIVLAHELIEMNVLRIKPPLFPLGGEICGDAQVANRGIELQVIRQYIIMKDQGTHPNIYEANDLETIKGDAGHSQKTFPFIS